MNFLVTWRDRETRARYPVGKLTTDDLGYHFAYLPDATRLTDFRPFLGFPEFHRSYDGARLFPFFAQRVMDSRRPDYLAYLEALGLSPGASQLDVLGRSSGQRKGDTVQVIAEPWVAPDGSVSHAFLVSGVRHAGPDWEQALESLATGDQLVACAEPDNPANPRAVQLFDGRRRRVGWLPDALINVVEAADPHTLHVLVNRVNGPEWPGHVRLVAQLSARVPAGFRPFAEPAQRAGT